jgi:hypothetical protein
MRHFSGEFEGVRLLMEDELYAISGGDGEDTDDVAPVEVKYDPNTKTADVNVKLNGSSTAGVTLSSNGLENIHFDFDLGDSSFHSQFNLSDFGVSNTFTQSFDNGLSMTFNVYNSPGSSSFSVGLSWSF